MTILGDDLMWTLNQYRAAEIRGAGVIMRLGRMADSSSLRRDLTRHLRDEGAHAWMWARAIEQLGGEIIDVEDAYQVRLGTNFGLPKTLNEMLVLTLVSEKRGVATYVEHIESHDPPEIVARTLRAILKDERWHVSYIDAELRERSRHDPSIEAALHRAEEADRQAVADLRAAVGVAS